MSDCDNSKQNTTGYYKTNQSSESIKSILSLNSSLTHSSPALLAAGFSDVIMQTASKVLILLHFAVVVTVDTCLSFKNLPKNLVQNTSKQRKHVPGVWKKEKKSLSHDNHWDRLWFPTRKIQYVKSLFCFVWLLWHSAYTSPTGACGVHASSRQSLPEATKQLNDQKFPKSPSEISLSSATPVWHHP